MSNLQLLIPFEEEIWKDIPGYEGYYQASSFGRIKSIERIVPWKSWSRSVPEKILTPCLGKQTGYLKVQLSPIHKDKHQCVSVHRLVCKAFDPSGYFDDADVNHEDGNKLNNRPYNLVWCTRTYNNEHAYKTGLRTAVKNYYPANSRKVVDTKSGKVYPSLSEACRQIGIKNNNVSVMLLGLRKNKTSLKYC